MDNEKKIDPALPEEETEMSEDISEEELPSDEVVIENFDEDKDEDDYAIFEVSEDELVIDMPEEMLEEVDEEMLPVIEMMLPLELERK